ncbi:hypothetical protein MKW92_013092 [Papaver armeniacum]|nr:hypothetical protein MKW92_013092 [Papaver armeniacum]
MEHLTEFFQCYEYSMTLPVMLIKNVKRKLNVSALIYFLVLASCTNQRKNRGKVWLDGLLVSPAVRICSISDVRYFVLAVCGYLYKPWKYTQEQAAVRASSGDVSLCTFSHYTKSRICLWKKKKKCYHKI